MRLHSKGPGLARMAVRLLLGGFVLIPVGAVAALSLRSPVSLKVTDLAGAAEQFLSWGQYRNILFHSPEYWKCFWNTLFLLVPAMALTVLFATLAAYGLSCGRRSRAQTGAVMVYILLSLLPTQILLVPNFVALSAMGLIGSRLSVVLVCAFSPYYVYFMFRICRQIAPEIYEAARMEGAGELKIYRSIAMPQMKSGIWLLVLIGSADLWNMVEQPLVFIQDPSKYPLTVYLRDMDNGVGYAGSIVFSLPVMLLFLLCGRDTVEQIELL